MSSYYPPGVSGNESQITGECHRNCIHCNGECACAETKCVLQLTDTGDYLCIECGGFQNDDDLPPCGITPCGMDDHYIE